MSDVPKPTKNRLIFTLGSVAFVAVNLIGIFAFVFRSDGGFKPRSVAEELEVPIEAVLAEPQQWDDLSVIATFAPICTSNRRIHKLVYEVESSYVSGVQTSEGDDSQVIANTPGLMTASKSKSTKEVEFEAVDSPGEVRFVERTIIANPTPDQTKIADLMKRTGRLIANGRVVPDSIDDLPDIDPLFLSTAVKQGDEWNQRIACDPDLNKGGEALAVVKVLGVYSRGNAKIVRLSREYKYVCPVPNVSGNRRSKDGGNGKMLVRTHEVLDFDVQNGVVIDKSTTRQTYFDRLGNGRDGMIMTTNSREVLRDIVPM